MEYLTTIITGHLEYAPVLIFFSLVMAGFNIPISEDAMLFISGYLASLYPHSATNLFISVYLGAYCGDLICFGLGRYLGEKFSYRTRATKMTQIERFYQKYGIATMIVGRFIPFGTRNALFLTAGAVRMSFLRFMIADWIACTFSTSFFFYLYYSHGPSVVDYIKKGNILLFFTFGILVVGWILSKKLRTVKYSSNLE